MDIRDIPLDFWGLVTNKCVSWHVLVCIYNTVKMASILNKVGQELLKAYPILKDASYFMHKILWCAKSQGKIN